MASRQKLFMNKSQYLARIRAKLEKLMALAEQAQPDANEIVIQVRKLAASAESYREKMKE